jgi:hypothetical protein
MPFGIDTFAIHLDQVADNDWKPFQLWNGGTASGDIVIGGHPLFAGRNFLGGNFLWGHAEATDANYFATLNPPGDPPTTTHTPDNWDELDLSAPLIAPIQAPQPQRQQMLGEHGFLAGALDASAICRKIMSGIQAREFTLQASGFLQIWLAIDSSAPLSADYWAGWADTVNNYVLRRFVSPTPFDVTQPCAPGIICRYSGPVGGSLRRDPLVNTALASAAQSYPGRNTLCQGFWADAPDPDPNGVRPNPALDWTRFDFSERPSLWRCATAICQADGTPINEAFSVDAVYDPGSPVLHKATDYMLVTNKWQPNISTIVNVGFSSTDEITNGIAKCMRSNPLPSVQDNRRNPSTVRGGVIGAAGRYLRTPGQKDAASMSPDEAQRLSNAGFPVFTAWEGVNVLARASPKQIGYFNPDLHAGTEDGMNAFTYCGGVLHQPPQTPVFFAIDFDAGDPNNTPNVDAKDWITRYFALIRDARDAYAQQNPDRFYLIGVYAGGEVLRWCYEQGIASSFWQAVSSGSSGSQPPARWPWYHANRWQYQFDDRHPTPPEPPHPVPWDPPGWNCLPGADPDADWGDGGTWSLNEPLQVQLLALEGREAVSSLTQSLRSFWSGLLNPLKRAVP